MGRTEPESELLFCPAVGSDTSKIWAQSIVPYNRFSAFLSYDWIRRVSESHVFVPSGPVFAANLRRSTSDLSVALSFRKQTFQSYEAARGVPEANDDVDTTYFFRDTIQSGFPSGKDIQVLLGFRNTGEASLTVTHIAGTLRAPGLGTFYVANFTKRVIEVVVEPGKEASFLYIFFIESQLAGHDFNIEFSVFYQDSAEQYSTTFFNSTIQVLEPVGVIDTQVLLMCLALLCGFIFATYTSLQASGMFPTAKIFVKKACIYQIFFVS